MRISQHLLQLGPPTRARKLLHRAGALPQRVVNWMYGNEPGYVLGAVGGPGQLSPVADRLSATHWHQATVVASLFGLLRRTPDQLVSWEMMDRLGVKIGHKKHSIDEANRPGRCMFWGLGHNNLPQNPDGQLSQALKGIDCHAQAALAAAAQPLSDPEKLSLVYWGNKEQKHNLIAHYITSVPTLKDRKHEIT